MQDPDPSGGACTRDGDCGEALSCCNGRCAACCTHAACPTSGPCDDVRCVDGACTRGHPFAFDGHGGLVPDLATVAALDGRGDIVFAAVDRTLIVVDLASGGGTILGSVGLSGRAEAVVTAAGLAAVTVRDGEGAALVVDVIDLSRPSHPRHAFVARLEGLVACDLAGDVLAALAGDTLWIVDLARPDDPQTLSKIGVECHGALDVAASGGRAVVACGEAGARVIDISDPTDPAISGRVEGTDVLSVLGGPSTWIAVRGPDRPPVLLLTDAGEPPDIEVLPGEASGLHVLDADGRTLLASGPDETLILGPDLEVLARAPLARAGSVHGGEAHVVVRDPDGSDRLVHLGGATGGDGETQVSFSLAPFSRLDDLTAAGSLASVSGPRGGVLLVEVSDPERPRIRRSFSFPGAVRAACPLGEDSLAVVRSTGDLVVIDAREPGASDHPAAVTEVADRDIVDAAPWETGLLVTDSANRLAFLAPSGPSALGEVWSLDLECVSTIEHLGDEFVLLVAENGASGTVVDLSAPGAPGTLTVSLAGDAPRATATDGTWLFEAAAGGIRTRRLDGACDPASLTTFASGAPESLLWHEGRLWASGARRLWVADVGPGGELDITHVLVLPDAGGPGALRPLAGGIAMASDGGLLLASTRTPSIRIGRHDPDPRPADAGVDAPAPTLIGAADGRTWLAGGDLVWTPGGDHVRLTAPAVHLAPWPRGLMASMGEEGLALIETHEGPPGIADVLPVEARSAASTGAALCVAAGPSGLVIVDVRDATGCEVTATLPVGEVGSVAAHGSWCHAIDGEGRVLSVCLVDPASPRIESALAGRATGVWNIGEHVALGRPDAVQILDVSDYPQVHVLHEIPWSGPLATVARSGDLLVATDDSTWFLRLGPGDDQTLLGHWSVPWDPASPLFEGDELVGVGDGALWSLDLACLR